MRIGWLLPFRSLRTRVAVSPFSLTAIVLATMLAIVFPISAPAQNPCDAEPDMRRAALDSDRPEPSNTYIGCHNGSDQILTIIRHRDRVILRIDYEKAKTQDTPSGWREFLSKHPTSAHNREAAEAVKRLTFEEYPASVLDGRQLLPGTVGNVDQCRSACSFRDECRAFTFAASQKLCTLWTSASSGRPDADSHSGAREAVAIAPSIEPTALPVPVQPPAEVTFDEYQNTTLSGRVRSSGRSADLAACRRSCANSADCQGFSYFPQRGVCTLWDAITFRRGGQRAVSGLRTNAPKATPPSQSPTPRQTGYSYEYGVDFNGGDLGDPVRDIDRNSCERLCTGHPSCRAFTYNTERRACFIKHSIERRVSFGGAISGTKR